MKKYISLLLTLSLIVSLVSCKKSEFQDDLITQTLGTTVDNYSETNISKTHETTKVTQTTSTTTTGTETESTTSNDSIPEHSKENHAATPTPKPSTSTVTQTTPTTIIVSPEVQQAPDINLVVEGINLSKQQWLDEIFEQANSFRISQGLTTFQRASAITWEAANIRAQEATVNLDRYRPNGQDCITVFNDLGHEIMIFSESIASSMENNAEGTFQYFLDYSPSRELLLSNEMKYLAIGYSSIKTQKGNTKHFIILHFYRTINIEGSYNSYTKQQWLDELFRLTNEYRAKHGKEALQKAPAVTWEVANLRADETTIKYEHDRPNGQKYYTAFTDLNTDIPNWCAENINCNHFGDSVQQVFQEWVDSPGHKANILSDNSKYLAIGYATDYYVFSNGSEDKAHFAVQIFH